jgi:hypothetical protein
VNATQNQAEPAPDDHYATHDDARPVQHPEESICWMLDVRAYGMVIANELHR